MSRMIAIGAAILSLGLVAAGETSAALPHASSPHRRPWPIYNGFNHQPSQKELRALHHQDVTSDEAREIDRLYDQLMSSSERVLRQQPALVH
jgi:Spy/CpxP family protein refolding chaperone